MLEIKTIHKALDNSPAFDRAVNEALADGWDLTRRGILPPYSDEQQAHPATLFAELERETEEEAEEEQEDDDTAEWVLTRDISRPYRCSRCGHKVAPGLIPVYCPSCLRLMRRRELE